ncbi:hypothetical protein Tco_0489398 [Tanacetum coccineum]
MHIRCGRRSIPRPRRQHARNQSLPREGGSGNEATITLNIERSSKLTEAEKEFQNMKKMHNETANGNRAKAQRGVGNVSMCSKGSSKRSPTSRKGLGSVGACHMGGWEILPSHLNPVGVQLGEEFDIHYGPNTSIRGQILADFIVEKPNEEGPLMEVQTVRKAISRTMDPINERIIMFRGVRNRTHPHEPRRRGIHLCTKNTELVHRIVNPQAKTPPINSFYPWPFYKWGIDISGPFPEGQGKVKFLIIAIDLLFKIQDSGKLISTTGEAIQKEGKGSGHEKPEISQNRKYYISTVADKLPPMGFCSTVTSKASHAKESGKAGSKVGRTVRGGRSTREGVRYTGLGTDAEVYSRAFSWNVNDLKKCYL